MYELTAFYLYKAVFMTELLVAEFLVCSGMKRKPLFVLRAALACVLCIGVSFAIPVFSYSAIYVSAVFIVMFAFSLLTLKLCYDENTVSVAFRGIAAYTIQHIAYQIFDLSVLGIGLALGKGASIGGAYGSGEVSEFFSVLVAPRVPQASVSPALFGELEQLFTYCSYLFVYILTYYLGCTFVLKKMKDSDKFELKNSMMFVLIAVFVLFNIVISSAVTYYSGKKFDTLYVVLLSLYNVVSAFFVVYIMLEAVFRKQLKRDYSAANRMLKQSAEQYALAKQNIELINMKCHDLKHQIRHLSEGGEIDGKTVAEIENMISIYDARVNTGNEALDIILTEKSLYCNQHGIKLYCIVDGSLLTFASGADLYSLFGNLLDNAIEAIEELEDGKRFINLTVRKINGFATVSTSNCLTKELEFKDGLPKTTKENKELHGYGMKSIRLICKRYNGEMTISARDGMFTVSIVFMN